MVLLDVLYIPKFKFNLLSVSSFIASAQAIISFYHDSFLIQEVTTKRRIGKGKRTEGLYVLDTNTSNSEGLYILDTNTSNSEISVNQVGSQIWHDRLGHPSAKVLQILKPPLQLKVVTSPKDAPCFVCPLAKQKRLSFISHHHMAAKVFDLIQCDVWGGHIIYLRLITNDHFLL